MGLGEKNKIKAWWDMASKMKHQVVSLEMIGGGKL